MVLQFSSPTKVLMGDGALEQLGTEVSRLGKRPLLVTDPGVAASGLVDLVKAPLDAAGIETVVFDGVGGNPTVEQVMACLSALRASSSDVLVAVGGGSAMDVSKAAAVLATNGGEVADYEGFDRIAKPAAPVIAVPTTVGTGSEVTKGAVITNSSTKVKMVIVSDFMFPAIAVLDARMVASLPGHIAAGTGMDALTHAIEGYVAKGANPLTDALNLAAISAIGRHLRPAVAGDSTALYEMLIASCMAGAGFHDAGLGLVHALANTLGGHFGVHHGTANALFLPYVMEFNVPANPPKFAAIAVALGEPTAGLSTIAAAKRAPALVHELAADIGVARTLTELNIPADAIPQLAEDALTQIDRPGNPRSNSKADLEALYRAAL
ncbi:L-threonine dehydrogenase [Phytohabitans flavus]|uniref:Alcohol dehydrogenase n=1 Tax=Phytohabitans flavus TaxID=1076124 RepID=A0A6F8XNA2_9ACTN|nr:iron-containing alcohol dehydrogenase [Phytohabitans flavus]BCB75305.1 alcohol dehydrogenase [Phytohabitans flavus]